MFYTTYHIVCVFEILDLNEMIELGFINALQSSSKNKQYFLLQIIMSKSVYCFVKV